MDATRAQAYRAKYGPWALVAGASTGLGAEYATQLAALGLHVALVARRQPALESLATTLRERYGVEARVLALDLAEDGAAERIDEWTREIDVGLLVYNATYSPIGAFLAMPLAEHERELAVNVRTPMALVWRLGRRFTARGRGGVILMGSMSGALGTALVSNYGATKAYTLILAEGLWEELRAQGIDVLAAAPASISKPGDPPNASDPTTMPAEVVARETLAALGHGPTITPGGRVRLASFFMRRVLTRKSAVRMMSQAMRSRAPQTTADEG